MLKGPNYWFYPSCAWMRIDLGRYQERPSNTISGFLVRLEKQVDFERQKESREASR